MYILGFVPPFSHPLFPERARLLTIDDPIGSGKLVRSDIYIASRFCETHPLTYLHSEAEDPFAFPHEPTRGGTSLRALLIPPPPHEVADPFVPY